jgi:hypothetical protein
MLHPRPAPQWNQRHVEDRQRRTHQEDPIDENRRIAGWSLPEDLHERRRIRNRLIVLAAAMPIVQLLRWLFR